MKKQDLIKEINSYVENYIGIFHEKRIERIDSLKLNEVLKKKNPYLFKAKYVKKAQDLVQEIVNAYLSSSEEGIFGDWLEGLAIFVNQKVYKGRKSSSHGIDLEFDKNGIRYIVAVKSGPNWGNSSQIGKMISDFNSARKVLKTSGANIQVVAVNGCCYGKTTAKNYYKRGLL